MMVPKEARTHEINYIAIISVVYKDQCGVMPQLGVHVWNTAYSIVSASAYKIQIKFSLNNFTQTLFSHKLVFRIGACLRKCTVTCLMG